MDAIASDGDDGGGGAGSEGDAVWTNVRGWVTLEARPRPTLELRRASACPISTG